MGIEKKEPELSPSKFSMVERGFLLGSLFSASLATGMYIYNANNYKKMVEGWRDDDVQKVLRQLNQSRQETRYLFDRKFIGDWKHCETMGEIVSAELNTGPVSKFEDCAYMEDVRGRALGTLDSCKEVITAFHNNPAYPFTDHKGQEVTSVSIKKIESRCKDMEQAAHGSCNKEQKAH